MRKYSLLAVIAVLLALVVGFLALDRYDKEVAKEHRKAFDAEFTRR